MVWSVFIADILNINLSQSVSRKKQKKEAKQSKNGRPDN
jgi:hypothetical protein